MVQHTLTAPVGGAAGQAREKVREASPGLIWLGRFGLAAKGAVYLLIGVVAARAAIGAGEQTTDSQGALGRIVAMPFGPLLLGIVAIGLAGYATWRVVQALMDTEHKGSDLKGLWARGAYLVSAFIHGALTVTAVGMLLGTRAGPGSSDASAQDWTARLMEQPLGVWLIALAGLGLIGAAGFQFVRAITMNFRDRLETSRMSARAQEFAIRAGRAGFSARGVVFGIMGLFLVLAAFRHEPGEAKGLAGALNTLAEQPYGPLLLGAVALGLALYGLYMFVEARYRRMVVS
jgi:hypothetical protein